MPRQQRPEERERDRMNKAMGNLKPGPTYLFLSL
jgi:hypothetical protein